MSPHETDEWLDGPKLAQWLESHCGITEPCRQLGPIGGRRMNAWKHGAVASLKAIDRILLDLPQGLHEIPAEFWLDEKEIPAKAP